jgi:hypothetical protein
VQVVDADLAITLLSSQFLTITNVTINATRK